MDILHFACPTYKAIRPWMITLVTNKTKSFQVKLGDVVEVLDVGNRCVVMDLQMFPKSCK